MSLKAPQSNTPRILINEGTHIARCIELIHIGTVQGQYMGEQKIFNKIRLKFELPEETHVFKEGEEAKPLVISQEFTLSMGKKSNLRPIVEGIIGAGLTDEEAYNFDHEQLVGMACLVNIKHGKTAKGNEYAKIASTSGLMKGQSCKPPFNPMKILTYDKWDEEYFQKLPDFIKDTMKASAEYKILKGTNEVDVDSVPFN